MYSSFLNFHYSSPTRALVQTAAPGMEDETGNNTYSCAARLVSSIGKVANKRDAIKSFLECIGKESCEMMSDMEEDH